MSRRTLCIPICSMVTPPHSSRVKVQKLQSKHLEQLGGMSLRLIVISGIGRMEPLQHRYNSAIERADMHYH
jgi:hypothetical protein